MIETNDSRIATREKQLEYGKQTPGYQNYLATVPKNKRKIGDPKTPNKFQVCSKRSWDGQVRKWRRDLHAWDEVTPESSPDASIDDIDISSLSLDGSSSPLDQSFEYDTPALAFTEDAELIIDEA